MRVGSGCIEDGWWDALASGVGARAGARHTCNRVRLSVAVVGVRPLLADGPPAAVRGLVAEGLERRHGDVGLEPPDTARSVACQLDRAARETGGRCAGAAAKSGRGCARVLRPVAKDLHLAELEHAYHSISSARSGGSD